MAADIFAKLGDIKGESLDDKHKDEIEVLSWSWGVTNAVTLAGTGAGQGKAHFGDLSLTHKIDKASPVLMQACATGVHLKEATITPYAAATDNRFRTIALDAITSERKATRSNVKASASTKPNTIGALCLSSVFSSSEFAV